MSREEKDEIILDLYKKRLAYLRGEIDEETYFSYVDNDTVDKLCSNKKGYKDLNAKLKATKTYINNYFKSIPSLKNIDILNELKSLEKEFEEKQKEKRNINIEKNMEFIYENYINYSKGIGSDEEENEKLFIDILDNFDYKSVDPKTKISNKNALSTRFNFFRDKSCNYYVNRFNKKRVDFFKYIDNLEETKKIKYLKKERIEENVLQELRELLYKNYIKYLNDLISEEELVDIAKKNNINLFSISDSGFLSSSKILKAIEIQSNIYAKDVVGNLDILDYLKNYGPLVTRLKREGKMPLYNDKELKIIKEIYDNFINYYDMKIDYDTYINNESSLVEKINSNSRSILNKKDSKYYIKYYLENVLNCTNTFNSIVNNSSLYKKCFNIFRDFSYNKSDPNTKDFVDKYRVNIYNYSYLFAKENNLLDLFNEMDKRRKDILSGNYVEVGEIDYNDLVNEYISSNYYLDDFIILKDINKDKFLNYIKYLKNTNDPLYVKYNSSMIGGKIKKDKYINNKIKGLYNLVLNGIPCKSLNKNRKFKLIDFYLYCDKFLFDVDKLTKYSKEILGPDIYNENYFELLKSIKINNTYITKEDLYKSNITYKGNIIKKSDIDYILDYMEKNNIPLTMKLFNEVFIRYSDNNLLELNDDIVKLKDISYKNIEFIDNCDNISDINYVPKLGDIIKNSKFNIVKTDYGYKVIGINDVDDSYILIKKNKDFLNKLLDHIIKDYGITIDVDDGSDVISLITKYTTYNTNNRYACEVCSFESNDSNDFDIQHLINDHVHELYNTCCLCHKCSISSDSFNVDDKIKLIKNVRNRIESRLNEYLNSFDKYVLIDNFDIVAYSLEKNE